MERSLKFYLFFTLFSASIFRPDLSLANPVPAPASDEFILVEVRDVSPGSETDAGGQLEIYVVPEVTTSSSIKSARITPYYGFLGYSPKHHSRVIHVEEGAINRPGDTFFIRGDQLQQAVEKIAGDQGNTDAASLRLTLYESDSIDDEMYEVADDRLCSIVVPLTALAASDSTVRCAGEKNDFRATVTLSTPARGESGKEISEGDFLFQWEIDDIGTLLDRLGNVELAISAKIRANGERDTFLPISGGPHISSRQLVFMEGTKLSGGPTRDIFYIEASEILKWVGVNQPGGELIISLNEMDDDFYNKSDVLAQVHIPLSELPASSREFVLRNSTWGTTARVLITRY